jgi:hypothetical protein
MDIIKTKSNKASKVIEFYDLEANWGGTVIPITVQKHMNGTMKYIAEVHDPEDGTVLDDVSRAKWAISAEQWAQINGLGNATKQDYNEHR